MSSGSLLGALRFRNFRNLWIGSLSSYAGQWIQQATIAWLAYDMTGSGSLLGAILGVRAIPMFLCAPLAGVAADRYDRRNLLLASQLLSAFSALAFGIVLATGAAQIWHLFVFVLVSGVAAVLDRTVRLTIIFDLVPRESSMQAVALNMVAFSITRVCGPAAAGYLIGWFGAAGNLFVQSVLYFIAAATALVIVFPRFEPRGTRRSAFSELAEGVRFAVTDSNARVLLLTGIMPFYLLVPIFGGLLPIYTKDIFGAGPEVLGMLLTSVGVGGVAGGWLAGKCMRYVRQGMVQAYAIFVMSAAFVGLAFAPGVAYACAALALAGAGEILLFTSNQATLQICVPQVMRGRMASLQQLYPGFIGLGVLTEGVLVDFIGIRIVTVLIAIAAAALTGALLTARGGLGAVRVG